MKIAGWFRRNNTIMAQAKDLSRQLQEAWDENDVLIEAYGESLAKRTNLTDQLHRVARERDAERRLRLEAEDRLFDHVVDSEGNEEE